MRFVFSADGVSFTRYDAPPPEADRPAQLLNTGLYAYLPSVPTGTPLGTVGQQGWGIYPIIDSAVLCEPSIYYDPEPAGLSWVLDGPLLGTSTNATETRVCVDIPIEDLRTIKLGELETYAEQRLYLSVQSTTAPNRWIITDQRARERFGSINLVLTDRAKDRTLGEDTDADPIVVKPVNTYWLRNPTIRLLKASDGSTDLQAVSEVPWGQVVKDVALKDETDEQAALACRTDILAETDWTLLSLIDPADYPWEPAYEDLP